MNIVQANQIGPISSEQPCGVNLEYDTAFTVLQRAATGSREQQFGDAVIPAVAPDWQHVEALAVELLTRTVDLRIIALLALAWTEMRGLAGYARGLALATCVLDQYWDTVHPQLESAGEFDPLPRLNAIAALTDPQALGHSARGATLLRWRFGQLTLRDAAAILERNPSTMIDGLPATDSTLQAELRTTLSGARDVSTMIRQLLDSIDGIHRQIASHLDASWVPDPIAVQGPLRVVYQATLTHPERPSPVERDESASARVMPSAHTHTCVQETSGEPVPINTREDVLAALENACVYLERAEPGHPVPLLLRRAQRLMHMNFYEIVRDMAPAALPQLDVLAGQPERRPDIATH